MSKSFPSLHLIFSVLFNPNWQYFFWYNPSSIPGFCLMVIRSMVYIQSTLFFKMVSYTLSILCRTSFSLTFFFFFFAVGEAENFSKIWILVSFCSLLNNSFFNLFVSHILFSAARRKEAAPSTLCLEISQINIQCYHCHVLSYTRH